jgi:hypothetical protein
MNPNLWKTTQLNNQPTGFVIPQDWELINFVVKNKIKNLALAGDIDHNYIKEILNDCDTDNQHSTDLLIVFANHLQMKLEDILEMITHKILVHRPHFLYVAVNKYLITTNQNWNDLTDDYDQDLMNIVCQSVCACGYKELARHNIVDLGTSYNFVHPTTNMYFKINA